MSTNETMTAATFSPDKKKMAEYRNAMLNPVLYRAGIMSKLPMGLLAGLKITELDDNHCKVTVPYKFLNKNPFNTTYWAVLGMAAEMAPGAMVMMHVYKSTPSVSTFVVGCEGKFIKRAIGLTTFIFDQGALIREAVIRAVDTGEAQEIVTPVTGYNDAGEVVSEFTFTWGLKCRKNKLQ